MSRRHQLTETAQRHVDEIGAFIAQDSIDAALKVYDALEEAFAQLAEMPGDGPHPRGPHPATPKILERLFVPRGL